MLAQGSKTGKRMCWEMLTKEDSSCFMLAQGMEKPGAYDTEFSL
jgi:hypothetical protein